MRRVLRWDVPVDDAPHLIGGGQVVHVACKEGPDVVSVWTDEVTDGDDPSAPPLIPKRYAKVYGTGWTVDWYAAHVGSVLCGAFVWHVYSLPDDRVNPPEQPDPETPEETPTT